MRNNQLSSSDGRTDPQETSEEDRPSDRDVCSFVSRPSALHHRVKLQLKFFSQKLIWGSASSFLRWQQEHNNKRKGNCNRNNKLHLKLERLIHTGSVLSGGLCLQMNVEKGNLHFYITNYRRCRFVEITGSFRNYYKSADVPRWCWSWANELLTGYMLNFWGLNHNFTTSPSVLSLTSLVLQAFFFSDDLFSVWNKKVSWHHLSCDAGETASCVPLCCQSGLIKVTSLW